MHLIVTKNIITALSMIIVAGPVILLGWIGVPEVRTDIWSALAITFFPLISSWFVGKHVSEWYIGNVYFKGLSLFYGIAGQVIPGFAEKLEETHKKITPEYANRFLTDEKFRLSELGRMPAPGEDNDTGTDVSKDASTD